MKEQFEMAGKVFRSYMNRGGDLELTRVCNDVARRYPDLAVRITTKANMYGDPQLELRLTTEDTLGSLCHRDITICVPLFGEPDERPRVTLFSSAGCVPFPERHHRNPPYSAPMRPGTNPPFDIDIFTEAVDRELWDFLSCVYGHDVIFR